MFVIFLRMAVVSWDRWIWLIWMTMPGCSSLISGILFLFVASQLWRVMLSRMSLELTRYFWILEKDQDKIMFWVYLLITSFLYIFWLRWPMLLSTLSTTPIGAVCFGMWLFHRIFIGRFYPISSEWWFHYHHQQILLVISL